MFFPTRDVERPNMTANEARHGAGADYPGPLGVGVAFLAILGLLGGVAVWLL